MEIKLIPNVKTRRKKTILFWPFKRVLVKYSRETIHFAIDKPATYFVIYLLENYPHTPSYIVIGKKKGEVNKYSKMPRKLVSYQYYVPSEVRGKHIIVSALAKDLIYAQELNIQKYLGRKNEIYKKELNDTELQKKHERAREYNNRPKVKKKLRMMTQKITKMVQEKTRVLRELDPDELLKLVGYK